MFKSYWIDITNFDKLESNYLSLPHKASKTADYIIGEVQLIIYVCLLSK